MFEELKKKAVKSSLALTVVFLLVGAVMTGLMASNMFYVVTGYVDFEQLEPAEIKNQLVTYDMKYNYGSFMTESEYNKNTSRTTLKYVYYMIATGDDYAEDYRFMAIKAPASYEKRMDKMAQNTNNWLTSEAIHVTGKIQKLDDEEYGYFVEALEDAGWTQAEIEEEVIPYYINWHENPSSAKAGFIFMFALGAFFLVWAIIRIVKACTGGYLKKLKKDIANAGYTEASIVSDYAGAAVINKKCTIRVGRLMTYFILGADARALPNNKMVWAYMNTVTHRTNGIKTGTTYSVQIEMEGKGSFSIGVDKQETAVAVLTKMSEMFPWVVVGYSDELKALYNKNRAEFMNLRYNTCEHVAVEPELDAFGNVAAASDTNSTI